MSLCACASVVVVCVRVCCLCVRAHAVRVLAGVYVFVLCICSLTQVGKCRQRHVANPLNVDKDTLPTLPDRISVEDTKLSTNKQHTLSHKDTLPTLPDRICICTTCICVYVYVHFSATKTRCQLFQIATLRFYESDVVQVGVVRSRAHASAREYLTSNDAL